MLLSSILAVTLVLLIAPTLFAIGSSGWFATRIKTEYQYTDYNAYRYPSPIRPIYPEHDWEQPEPYFAEFPEHRTLIRITQAFGPQTSIQARFQYSDLSDTKDQRLYFLKYAREVNSTTVVSAAWQMTEQPAYMDGHALMLAWRYDRGGWILLDAGIGVYRNAYDSGGVSPTVAPTFAVRWSVNSVTALTGRWEGYRTVYRKEASTSHALTGTLSRYFSTQTAVHLMARYYTTDKNIQSLSPAIEVAQYIRWNLTFRAVYRYYDNGLEEGVSYDPIQSHALRGFLEWQVGSDLKLHFKLRRYWSGDDVKMNTYLVGFEYTV